MKAAFFALLFFTQVLILYHSYYLIFLRETYRDEALIGTVYARTSDNYILAVGNSHVKRAINPLVIKGAANVASGGQNIIQSYYKLKTLIDCGVFSPKVVILSADPEVMGGSYNPKKLKPNWMWDKYLNYPEIAMMTYDPYLLPKSFDNIFPYRGDGIRIINEYLPNSDKKEDTLSDLGPGLRVHYKEGYATNTVIGKDIKTEMKPHKSDALALDSTYVSYFKKTIKYLRERNITVLIVKYPLMRKYVHRSMASIGSVDAYDKFIRELAENQDGVYVLDYQVIFNDKPYFIDSNHLNEEGSIRFSKILRDKMSKMGLYNG